MSDHSRVGPVIAPPPGVPGPVGPPNPSELNRFAVATAGSGCQPSTPKREPRCEAV